MLTDQARALYAAERITLLTDRQRDQYVQVVQGLPANIQRMGLIGALADCSASSNPLARRAGTDIELWLQHSAAPIRWNAEPSTSFIDRLATCSGGTYYQATLEAVRYCVWLKRLSRAGTGADAS